LILTIISLCFFPCGSFPGIFKQTVTDISKRVHVYCECHNRWINGRVENFARVDLRDGTSFGPILFDATVEVNGQKLAFDSEKQIYKGNIGKVEQWQEIPIQIHTQDSREVQGYIVAVFMVRFTKPQPFTTVPLGRMLPVAWEYSEGSMHTVDLEFFSDEEEPVGIEVRGNHTTVDFNKLGIKIKGGESIHLQVLPPWTSNFEFSGNLTRRSKTYFITSATLTVRLVD
jgi:hypothetical protein